MLRNTGYFANRSDRKKRRGISSKGREKIKQSAPYESKDCFIPPLQLELVNLIIPVFRVHGNIKTGSKKINKGLTYCGSSNII
nr:MAG TPA: hypothetical protein [Bacteriophage sp.]